MPQTNDQFIFRSFERLGFEDFFNEAYLKGKEAKLPEIPFEPAQLSFGKATLVVLPKVIEDQKLGEGFYVMKGYFATRQEEGQAPVAQFLPVYKTIGFTVDEANELLRGGAVRHVASFNKNKEPVYAYSQINFNERTENNNFKMMKRSDDGSLLKALGPVGIIAKQEEKVDIYDRLQKGQRVAVNVRNGDSSQRLYVQAAVRKVGQGVDLLDSTGKLLKQFPADPAKRLQPVKTVEPDKPVPDATINMVAGKEHDDGPTKGRKVRA